MATGTNANDAATPWWKSKAKLAAGAVALIAVVLVAVLVPTLSNKGGASSSAGKATVVVPANGAAKSGDLQNVVNALLVANTPVDLPEDLAAKQAAAAGDKNATAPTTTTTTTTPTTPTGTADAPTVTPVAPAKQAQVTTLPWPALQGAPATTCYPKDGKEVVDAVSGTKCTVIILTNGGNKPYDITQQMNVTSTKIIIGNPIDMPKLNATGKTIHRLFEVRAGGHLEISAVRLYRAPPEVLPTNFKLFAGGTVRVLLGGTFNAYGCIFLLQPQTVASFMRELDSPLSRYRIIGGHVLVLGGNIQLIGCQAFRWQPLGNPILNVVQIGREVAVIAGNALCVGYFDAVGTLFLSAINVGNLVAVLGGTSVLVGAGNINAAVANNQLGAGKNIFVGGGVLITVGYQNIGAFVLLLRSGFATHAVGGGVLIHIGHIHVRAWGVCGVFNAGQTHAVGGGIFQKLGGVLITDNLNFIFAGAGGNTFVGGGEAYWLGAPQTRCLLTTSQHGVGGIYFNGGGYVNVIGCPSASVNGVRAQFLLGGETFIGGGIVNYIHYKRFNAQLCNAFFGQGTQVFNGGGGVTLVNSFSRNRRPCQYTTPNAAAIFVGGRQVGGTGRPGVNRNQFITRNKIVVYSNKTNANKPILPWNKRQRRVQVDMSALANSAFEVPNTLLMVQSSLEDSAAGSAAATPMFKAEDFQLREGAGMTNFLKTYHAFVQYMQQQESAANVAAAAEQGETKVSVSEDTKCFLCNVAPYPTADRVMEGNCQTSEACKGATALDALKAAAAEVPNGDLPIDSKLGSVFAASNPGASGTPLPDSNLIWHEMSVYCPGAAGHITAVAACSDADLLKATVAAYVDTLGFDGVSVAVAPTEVHAAVADVVPDDTKEAVGAPLLNEQDCFAGTKYNVYLSTLDGTQVPDLVQAFDAIVQDPTDFLAYVNSAKDAVGDDKDKACGLTMKYVSDVAYPPVERMPAFQPRGLGFKGPSISIGSADSIVPVSEVVKGNEYTLFLQNFPPATPYEVRLMHGLDPEGTVIAAQEAFGDAADSANVAEIKFTPSAMALEDGRYYLKANLKNFPAFFTVSQPFVIRSQATPGRRW